MKKLILFFIFIVVFAGGLWAQDSNSTRKPNAIVGQLRWIGAGISYERFILPKLSVVGEAGYFMIGFGDENKITAFDVRARWYPWAGRFFGDVGLGCALIGGDKPGFLISPEVGWRFDPGQPNGLILQLQAGVNIILGVSDSPLPAPTLAHFGFGMGWAF
jgi:hypothetical protein